MFVYGKERLSRFMFVKIGITSYIREMEGNSNLLQVKNFGIRTKFRLLIILLYYVRIHLALISYQILLHWLVFSYL